MNTKRFQMLVVTSLLASHLIGRATAASVRFPAYGIAASPAVTTSPVLGIATHVSLPEAIEIAVARSPQGKIAHSAYRTAKANALLVATAAAPSLTANGLYSTGLQSGFGNSKIQKSVDLELQQLVYDGGHTTAQLRSANSARDAAAQIYNRALQTIAYSVGQAYYTALQAESQVSVQLDIVNQDRMQERLISAQIRAGTVAPIDLETAQIPTAQARVAVVRAQGSALAALAAFAVSMGLPADAGVEPILQDGALMSRVLQPYSLPLAYHVAIAQAMSRRPDYLAARAQLIAAEQFMHAVRLGHAPSVVMQVQSEDTSFGSSNTQSQINTNVQAQISLPIYDRGVIRAQSEQAAAQLELAQSVFTGERLGIESDVRQGLVGLVAAQAALVETKDELVKARAVLAATRMQYSSGQTTLPLLLNAQAQIAVAQTDRLTAIFALRQAEQTYIYALGVYHLGDS